MRYLPLLLIIIVITLIGINLVNNNRKPSIEVIGGTTYNAGIVDGKSTIVHTFQIKNPNAFSQTITATPGCDCTKITMPDHTIAAYGRSEITLHVEPESKNISVGVSVVSTHGNQSAETWIFLTATKSDKPARPHHE